MSAGHGHKRPNLKHPAQLAHLLSTGGAPELMHRWQKLDPDHDVPDLAGYNVTGTVRYIDRDAFKALIDPEYAKHILGEEIDTGLSPEDTIAAIAEHEGEEKVLLDALNGVNGYQSAHEYATVGENEKVTAKGSTPLRYNRGLRKIIKFCETKTPTKVPVDLCCAPYLDDPDKNDLRVLKQFQQLGVIDSFKLAKRGVDYSPATGEDRCERCKNWQHIAPDLSPCAVTEGLVRNTYWCNKFQGTQAPKQATIGDQEAGQTAVPPTV